MHRIAAEILPCTGTNHAKQKSDFYPDGAQETVCHGGQEWGIQMVNFCTRQKGTIAVFLTLILIPTFIFSGMMVDGSRILASKNLISGAGDLAMNAALSNYHEELNKTYGLLAMADTAEEVESIMQDCFEMSLNACGVSQEDFSKALVYLELTEGGFSASDMVDTEIYQTEVFKQEVLEYMKYRAPVTLVNRAIEGKVGKLETLAEERAAADAELKFEKELNDVQQLMDELNELVDSQIHYVNQIGTEQSLIQLLSATENNYDRITMLAVAYYRMLHCTDSASGDMKSLMERMVDLSCDVGTITADNASNLIKMKRIANAMQGKEPEELLENLEEDSDEYQETERLISDYGNALANMEEGIENTGRQLDELVESSFMAMHAQWECADKGSENCTDILDKLNEIKDKISDCQGKYENWKDAVSNLSNGKSKEAYQKSIEEVSGLFEDGGTIADFEEKIVKNRTYFDEVVATLDQVTFVGSRVDYDISSKAVFMGDAGYGEITESGQIIGAAEDFMVRYNSPTVMALSGTIHLDVDTQDPFVEKLKNTYCKTDGADKEAAKEEAKKWKDKLKEKKTELENLLTSQDIADENVRSIGGNELPTVWLGVAPGADYAGSSVKAEGSLEDKGSRKKASESGSNNLNQDNAAMEEMSSLGAKMAGVGEAVLEPLYCTEYVMGMFSYYTVNRERDGNEIGDPESLSRAAMKENAIYRAEVEYILWGSPNARSNVNKTKAIIFAANYVFNMSFAFTDGTLNRQARTIAALFPVGFLGRAAIKSALLAIVATIETVDNMIDLTKGKPVPLVKQPSSWKTWLGTPGAAYSTDDSGFTYEDYLWILVCVNMYIPSQQTKLLGRAADCIELNMTDKKAKPENTLKEMHTMISVDASVYIDTFFMQKLGGAGYDVSYDRDAFKVNYHGIQGY